MFEYFVGYEVGTDCHATQVPCVRRQQTEHARPRETRRRLLLNLAPSAAIRATKRFRYSLLDGVRDGFLINPVVVDARTDITTQLLSDKGYAVASSSKRGQRGELHAEDLRRFFSGRPTACCCKTFLANGLRDPISHEFGKAIVFAVSQARRQADADFQRADDASWPGRYRSILPCGSLLRYRMRGNTPSTSPTTICWARPSFLDAGASARCGFASLSAR